MVALRGFERSLELHGKPTVLGQLTKPNVRVWVNDLRMGKLCPNSRPCNDQSIAPRHTALKTFSHKYIFKELKLTTADLLAEVDRWNIKLPTKDPLTPADFEQIRASLNQPTFEHIRGRAIFEMTMATALRYDTLILTPPADLNKITGEVTVVIKGK